VARKELKRNDKLVRRKDVEKERNAGDNAQKNEWKEKNGEGGNEHDY